MAYFCQSGSKCLRPLKDGETTFRPTYVKSRGLVCHWCAKEEGPEQSDDGETFVSETFVSEASVGKLVLSYEEKSDEGEIGDAGAYIPGSKKELAALGKIDKDDSLEADAVLKNGDLNRAFSELPGQVQIDNEGVVLDGGKEDYLANLARLDKACRYFRVARTAARHLNSDIDTRYSGEELAHFNAMKKDLAQSGSYLSQLSKKLLSGIGRGEALDEASMAKLNELKESLGKFKENHQGGQNGLSFGALTNAATFASVRLRQGIDFLLLIGKPMDDRDLRNKLKEWHLSVDRRDAERKLAAIRRGGVSKAASHQAVTEFRRIGGVDMTSVDSAEKLIDTFGFRGVQWGKYVDDKKRQEILRRSAAAFSDLSDVVGLSPKELGVAGLGVAFGARGSGNASAHYEREHHVFNLTRDRGDGSVAHEWFHALDFMGRKKARTEGGETGKEHNGFTDLIKACMTAPKAEYLERKNTQLKIFKDKAAYFKRSYAEWTSKDHPYQQAKGDVANLKQELSEASKNGDSDRINEVREKLLRHEIQLNKLGVNREQIRARANDFVRMANKTSYDIRVAEQASKGGTFPSRFAEDAVAIDKVMGRKVYYQKPIEIAARAFETWVAKRLKDEGRENNFLTDERRTLEYPAEHSPVEPSPYPAEAGEVNRISEAMERLFESLRGVKKTA